MVGGEEYIGCDNNVEVYSSEGDSLDGILKNLVDENLISQKKK